MGEGNHRQAVLDSGQRLVDLRVTLPGIADPQQPEVPLRPIDAMRLVVDHRGAGLGQGAAYRLCPVRRVMCPVPPVMVPEDGVYAKGGHQPSEQLTDLRRIHAGPADDAVDHVVAEQQNQIRSGRIDAFHHAHDLGRVDIGRSGVKVAHHRHRQGLVAHRPARQRQGHPSHYQLIGFPPEAPKRQRRADRDHHDQHRAGHPLAHPPVQRFCPPIIAGQACSRIGPKLGIRMIIAGRRRWGSLSPKTALPPARPRRRKRLLFR